MAVRCTGGRGWPHTGEGMNISSTKTVRRMYDSGHGQSYGVWVWVSRSPVYDDASPIVRMLLFLV